MNTNIGYTRFNLSDERLDDMRHQHLSYGLFLSLDELLSH